MEWLDCSSSYFFSFSSWALNVAAEAPQLRAAWVAHVCVIQHKQAKQSKLPLFPSPSPIQCASHVFAPLPMSPQFRIRSLSVCS
uniref:Uncharacterized protein n=1 Tax=Physcomitrium patens TaxID=3218 RepID=A0A2K1JMV8_PHYPA|nr:hypothetical protein PHYPA_017702 [Physcomitrium patens]